jgi:hypothetical protein
MHTFNISCVTLPDVCEHNKLDIEYVREKLNNSHISYGTNDDTLITKQTLEKILEVSIVIPENTLISLGC